MFTPRLRNRTSRRGPNHLLQLTDHDRRMKMHDAFKSEMNVGIT